MAIDQTPSPSTTETKPTAAIDNEFPTYRAISSMGVISLVFGLLSVFAFADLWFLLLSALAVVTGWLSIRKIQRMPEILTGASYARLGIGIGMLFGLTAVTHEVVQEIMTSADARNFANHFIEVIKDKPLSVALWYEQSPDYRSHNEPDKVVDDLKRSKAPASGGDPYTLKTTPYLLIKERLKSPNQTIQYSKIENKVIVGLTTYANVLFELDGPVTQEYPKKEFGLMQIVKNPGAGKYDWVVQEFKYPYKPMSAKVEVPHQDDDGHGHAGSH